MNESWPRVFLQPDFYADGLSVYVIQKVGDQRALMRQDPDSGTVTWERYDPQTTPEGCSFRIDNDSARALLDALQAHFQGATDMRTVRSDLLHERDRRDQLEDRMFTLFRIVAGQQWGTLPTATEIRLKDDH